jgi:membrane protein YqaA with SNARE-associated domain
MKELGQWLAKSAAALGPWGLFLIALGDSAFIPLPQGVDALLIAQSIAAPSTAYFAAAVAVVGSVLGSYILYSLAKRGGEKMLEKKASQKGAQKLRKSVEKDGALALIPPTMIPLPLPMKLFVIAAGVFQMPIPQFLAALTFARCVRYFGEAFVAVRYGDRTTEFLRENAVAGIAIGLGLVAVFFVIHRWSTRRVQEG